ncbi:MAG: hypothetical protein JNN00_07875 [Chitinophagaceae bacterium]|nr:hypothetical protein [Chitinophagaceae bacterium]
MKVTGIILMILGSLMIVLNLLAYLGSKNFPGETETINIIAYYIGFNIFFIAGSVLLIIGYRLRKKTISKKIKGDLLDNFLSDSKQNDQA